MNKKHPWLEDISIPEIDPNDLLETIQVSKQILKEAPLQKLETSKLRQVLTILRIHFPMLFTIELIICILMSIATLVLSSSNASTTFQTSDIHDSSFYCFSTVLIGSLFFSITTAIELTRSQLSSAWELESVCAVRIEKIILCKLVLLSVIAFVGIGILSIGLASMQQNIDVLTIFMIGLLPYLIITTLLLQLQSWITSIQALLTLYVVFTSLYGGMLFLFTTEIATLPLSYVVLLLVTTMFVCTSLSCYQLQKQR